MSRILTIITARGGSRGIARKNVLPIAGQPLIVWSIDAARDAGLDRIVVTTDDEEIAAVSRAHGADVPFMRPAHLATDAATSVDAVLHCLDTLAASGERSDLVLLLQPTSPLRTAEDIAAAMRLLEERAADAVVSVTAAKPPQWLRRVDADGWLRPWADLDRIEQRQQAEPVYQYNGAIYLIRRAVFEEQRTFVPDRTAPLVMPPERSIDVDTPWDFELADLLLRTRAAARG